MAKTQNPSPLRSSPKDVQPALIDWASPESAHDARPVLKRQNRSKAVSHPMAFPFMGAVAASPDRALFPSSLVGFRAFVAALKSELRSTTIVRHTVEKPETQTGDGSQLLSLPHGDKDQAGQNRYAGQQALTLLTIGSNMERIQTAPDQARSASPTGPNPDDLTPPQEDATWSEVFPLPPARTIGIRVKNRTFYLFAKKGGA